MFYSFELYLTILLNFKKISLKKFAWSFCMGSLPSMERTSRSATMDFDPTSPPGGCCEYAYAYVREEYIYIGLTSSGHPQPG